jgi:perosamine synthetase
VAELNQIPVYSPFLDEEDFKALKQAFDSGWISSKGPEIGNFESLIAKFTNFVYASSTSNGTTALHLAFAALGTNPVSKVIAPSMTYVASVTPALHLGANLHLVDVDPTSWLADFELEDNRPASNENAKTIYLSVDLFGNPVDLLNLRSALGEDVKILSDSAESIGSRILSNHAGNGSDIATFSFFGNKTITTGEGGMVCTNNQSLYSNVEKLKNQGLSLEREYFHDVAGFNFRMTNLQAALGVSQLLKIEEILIAKKRVYDYYNSNLDKQRFTRQEFTPNSKSSHWMCAFLADSESAKDRLRRNLALDGIETRPFFTPLHMLPFLKDQLGSFPVSEDLWRRGFILPSSPNLNLSQLQRIVERVNA